VRSHDCAFGSSPVYKPERTLSMQLAFATTLVNMGEEWSSEDVSNLPGVMELGMVI
jgi:hypothetical protein